MIRLKIKKIEHNICGYTSTLVKIYKRKLCFLGSVKDYDGNHT